LSTSTRGSEVVNQ